MRDFIKPNVVVSKCLGFEHCRYNGETIAAPLVQKMVPYVNFAPYPEDLLELTDSGKQMACLE
jgi:uncharacterized protein YbbK (DUF523 family)